MAKTKQLQFQQDLTTPEEWEKFLQRDGLCLVDIYSQWCGPCLAMQGNLKKIKLEFGGDFLNLGMARCDNIDALARFRQKSEPSWMFIAQGQQVNLMFGSNAPELQKMILEEMKKERDCLEGKRVRKERLPEEYSEEEQVHYDKLIAMEAERERIKVEKEYRQLRDRRIAQSKNILDTMAHLGLILIFPHAIKKSTDVLDEFLPNTGIAISKRERPALNEAALEDIEFLSPDKMPEFCRNHLYSERALALMITVDQEINPGSIEDTILRFAYGPTKTAPGEPGFPGYALLKSQLNKKVEEAPPEPMPELDVMLNQHVGEEAEEEVNEEEEEEEEVNKDDGQDDYARSSFSAEKLKQPDITAIVNEGQNEEEEVVEEEAEDDIWGLWTPANELVKATALKYFFPLITSPLILPDPEPIPAHLAIAFEVFKKHDVYKLMEEHENEVMAYGFFTSDQCDEARLVAKTKKAYEKGFSALSGGAQYGEKLVLKVSKKTSDSVLAFAQLGPSYMSSNVVTGERDCAKFFPENYDDEEPPSVIIKTESKMADTTDTMEEHEDMIFDSVLHGAEEEDIGELDDEVEEIPPMEMTELPQVDEDEEAKAADKATSPPPAEDEGQGQGEPHVEAPVVDEVAPAAPEAPEAPAVEEKPVAEEKPLAEEKTVAEEESEAAE